MCSGILFNDYWLDGCMYFYMSSRCVLKSRGILLHKLQWGILFNNYWLDGSVHFNMLSGHIFSIRSHFLHRLHSGILFKYLRVSLLSQAAQVAMEDTILRLLV